MKRILILYLIISPIIVFSQNDAINISLKMEEDSTFNFVDANKSMYSFLSSNIDASIEKGGHPKEKAYVRCFFKESDEIDTILVTCNYESLKLEVSNAMKKIDTLTIPKMEKSQNKYQLVLIIERWKEAGLFNVSGFLTKDINEMH